MRCRHGSVLLLRVLELADAIDLVAASSILREGRRVKLRRQASEALVTEALPLEIELGTFVLPEALGASVVPMRARLFSFGVVSVIFELPLAPGAPLTDVNALVAGASGLGELDEQARRVAADLAERCGPAMTRATRSEVIEGYAILWLREIDGDPFDDPDALAHILLAEPSTKPIARSLRDDVLGRPHRWFDDDLVLVHYEAAIVVDPAGTDDLVTVIELALAQLLELRAWDLEIDREVARVHAELGRARGRGWWLLGASAFARTRNAMERLLELAELADSADNAIKFASDLYLADLYVDSLERFRVSDWRGTVQRKLGLAARAYELLKSEGDVRRNVWIETAMVVLILVELFALLMDR